MFCTVPTCGEAHGLNRCPSGMAAGMERLEEYRTHNAQFCKRLWDFLQVAFKFKVCGREGGMEQYDWIVHIFLPSRRRLL